MSQVIEAILGKVRADVDRSAENLPVVEDIAHEIDELLCLRIRNP